MSDDCQRAAGTCFNMVRTDLVFFCFYSACCPVSTTDGAAIGFRRKVIIFCLFTFNDDRYYKANLLSSVWKSYFFIIMLYYIFSLWNSCSILLIYSNMLLEKWFLSSTISTIFSLLWCFACLFFVVHMFGQTTKAE